jgi:hypothetical protein
VSDDLTAWLRRIIGPEMASERERAAHFESVAEREGEYHWFEARENAARLEAELAILDEHYILTRDDRDEAYEEFSIIPRGGANQDRGCVTCHYEAMGGVRGAGVCRTVKLLGTGYRHRPGYQEAWKP